MRTFIAIEIPSALHPLIRQQQQQMEALLATARLGHTIRWTPADRVHLTLRFLGETTKQQHHALHQTLASIAAQQKPSTLAICEVGCFPNRQLPNIVWLGLQQEGDALLHLQEQIEQAAQRVGFAAERKPFRPHLTIGRVNRSVDRHQARKIGQLLSQYLMTAPLSHQPEYKFTITQFVHIQSQLQSTGAVYTPLQIFIFAKG